MLRVTTMSTITSKLDPVLYIESMLLKRQRGLKQGNTKKLKFQERFCRLTSTSLDYYDPNPKKRNEGPRGQFAVEQIKVVEAMEKGIFGKEYPYAFQIGDSTEIMYFVTKTEREMEEWLASCRHVSQDAGNTLLTYHHHGVFGLVNKGRWSCCANPRRACPGCSTSTIPAESDKKKDAVSGSMIPVRLTPPTQRSPRNSPIMFNKDGSKSHSRPHTPNLSLRSDTTDESDDDDSMDSPPPRVLVRRFTLADPLMMPGTPKTLKELRKANSEKEDTTDDESDLKDEGERKKRSSTGSYDLTNDKKNTLNSIESTKEGKEAVNKEIEGGRSQIDPSNDSMNKILTNGLTNQIECTRIPAEQMKSKNLNSKKIDGDVQVVAKKRCGASSPSPSVDSGRGGSRPNSQIDVTDLRVSRTDSVGKKSIQSVISDQGVMAEEGKRTSCKQTIVEESDASKQDKQVDETAQLSSETTDQEEKYKDQEDHHHVPEKTEQNQDTKESSSTMTSPMRKEGSTSAPEIIFLSRHTSPESGSSNSARPVSYLFSESDVSESSSVTPQHRKHLANISSDAPKDRPMSMLMKEVVPNQQYSALHQACKDGDLDMLEESLNMGGIMNLDEPSNTPLSYTPLFIAYINDHYQTMIHLLEHGANPNCEEPREKASLLQRACEKGCLDIVDLLLKYKAKVNKRDSNGCTPLMAACKNGHFDVVEMLLENGANVDDDSNIQRTALHEATEEGHTDITELLLRQSDVDPMMRNAVDDTPYDIAYRNKNKELMLMLQLSIPKEVRPYSLLGTNTGAATQRITSLIFREADTIITGSRDCHVKFFSATPDLSEKYSIRLTDTVLDISMHGGSHVILGSTSIQLVDMEAPEKRRTIADDTQEDENLLDPPLHLAQFGPKGRMVTASVENNIVKLWPSVSQTANHMMYPEHTIYAREDRSGSGYVYSLSVSPNPNFPWLAVGVQPGKMPKATGLKLVYCYDWTTNKLHHIFDAGDGGVRIGVHTTFSPDGKRLAIGCSEHLCIWQPKTGSLLQKFTLSNKVSINSLCYSPNGAHLAAGLSSGEIQVFEIASSSVIFFLPATSDPSPVMSVAYSSCGKKFGSGYKNGTLRLWEAHIGNTST